MHKFFQKKFFTEYWHVAILPDNALNKLSPVYWLENPKGYQFFADPFLVEKAGRYFLFVERYSYLTKYGVIDVLEIDASGKIIKQQTLLDTASHLSFPCVFAHQGIYYLLPEAHKTRELSLYRFTKFPWQCEKAALLLKNIEALDSTLFYYDNYFWLFTTPERSSENEPWELHLYFSQSLSGQWQAHPGNPVVKNDGFARNAGHVFQESGQLLRPAQDCRAGYGKAVILRQITTLSTTAYAEESRRQIKPVPDWPYHDGCHTLNQAAGLMVLDAKEVKFTPFKFIMLYKRRFRRWFG